MDKTARKLQNQNFGGKKVGDIGGQANFFFSGGGRGSACPSFPSLGETLKPKGFLMFSGRVVKREYGEGNR